MSRPVPRVGGRARGPAGTTRGRHRAPRGQARRRPARRAGPPDRAPACSRSPSPTTSTPTARASPSSSSGCGRTRATGGTTGGSPTIDVDGEQVPGGALVSSVLPPDAGGVEGSYVDYIGVHRRARGRGVAKALLHTVIADAARRGRNRVGLEVDADSPTGRRRPLPLDGLGDRSTAPSRGTATSPWRAAPDAPRRAAHRPRRPPRRGPGLVGRRGAGSGSSTCSQATSSTSVPTVSRHPHPRGHRGRRAPTAHLGAAPSSRPSVPSRSPPRTTSLTSPTCACCPTSGTTPVSGSTTAAATPTAGSGAGPWPTTRSPGAGACTASPRSQ